MTESERKNLYRIVKFHHAVDILNGTLHFSHPSKWDDPYETRVKHSREYMMFAQCWGKKSMSDAMWRIYSPDHLGVRIKTTREKLDEVLKIFLKKNRGFKRRLKDVTYEKTPAVREKTGEIVAALNKEWNASLAADLLFHKREAFSHEEEVRALIFCPTISETQKDLGLKVDVDGHNFIESIYLDPRAPKPLVEALTNYLKGHLKFSGPVRISELYTNPDQFIVVDPDEL